MEEIVRMEPQVFSVQQRQNRVQGILAAAAVVALGVGASLGALELGYWVRGPGPGFFPLWLGILLVILGALWILQLWRGENVHITDPVPAGGHVAVGQILGGLLVTIALLDVIGFQLVMTLFVLFILLVVSRRKVLESLIAALISGFGVYSIFANLLRVFLPTASISFLSELGL